MADPLKYVPPHRCFHAEFGWSESNSVGLSSGEAGEPQELGSAGATPRG